MADEKKVILEDTPETRKKLMEELNFNLTFRGKDIQWLIEMLWELPASKSLVLINSINNVVYKTMTAHIEKVNAGEIKEEKEEVKKD